MKPEEKLYRAIGGVGEDLVDQALSPGKKKTPWRRWAALAAALALVAGGSLALLPRFGGGSAGGAGHGEGSSFMSYAGPIFPLTVLEGGEGLAASREVTLDFSAYHGEGQGGEAIAVTDRTILQNPGAEDRTVTIAYPFVGNLSGLELPALTIDGEAVETRLYAGKAGSSSRSWEDYREALASGEYMAAAFGEVPALDQTVAVWRVYDSGVPEGSGAVAPHAGVGFSQVPEGTRIYSYGFNSFSTWEDGSQEFGYSIPEEGSPWREQPRLLIIQGELPAEHTFRAGTDGSLEEELPGVEIWVETEETTLGEALDLCLEHFYLEQTDWLLPGGEYLELARRSVRELIAPVALGTGDPERYDYAFLEDIFSGAASWDRVFWVSAQVTIPAGGEVEVEAVFSKEPSFDYACAHTENQGVWGYDLVTALGSALEFERSAARLENIQGVEIVRQNFGFDLEAGVLAVELDPAQPRYYIEVRALKGP